MTLLFQIGTPIMQIPQNLQNMGFFVLIFPFLLALAIFYGILWWAFQDKMPKSAIALISIILSFFVMLYASNTPYIVQFMAQLSGAGLIVGSGILFVGILLGLVGFKVTDLTEEGKTGKGRWVFIIGVIVIAILIFFGAGGDRFGLVPPVATSSEFMTALFVIAVIGLAIWWLGGDEGAKKEEG